MFSVLFHSTHLSINKDGIARMTPLKLPPQIHSLPTILYIINLSLSHRTGFEPARYLIFDILRPLRYSVSKFT